MSRSVRRTLAPMLLAAGLAATTGTAATAIAGGAISASAPTAAGGESAPSTGATDGAFPVLLTV